MLINLLIHTGNITLSLFQKVGHFILFFTKAILGQGCRPFYIPQIIEQLFKIGWLSLPVIALTCFFTGAVLALQIYTGGSRFNAEQIVPSIVLIAILRELGPVLGALMVAGRVSAAIAAEIGTMRVTEQIDAMSLLAADPMKYLITPRVISSIIALPFLVFIGNIIAIAGGWVIAISRLNFNGTTYLRNTAQDFVWEDLNSGLIKAAFFGGIIALCGCYHGFNSKGGAQGVGRSTTYAVVSASILILTCNYFLTEIFFSS